MFRKAIYLTVALISSVTFASIWTDVFKSEEGVNGTTSESLRSSIVIECQPYPRCTVWPDYVEEETIPINSETEPKSPQPNKNSV